MKAEDRISSVIENIKESFEDIGLYMVDANVATSDKDFDSDEEEIQKDFRDKLITGEAAWIVQTAFTVGKVAWSDRVLNPEKFEEDQTFREIMPTEAELVRQRYIDAAKSGDISKAFEE